MLEVWSLRESTKSLRQPPAKLSEEFLEWRLSGFPMDCSPEKLINNADSQDLPSDCDSGGLEYAPGI